jgi:hypothetical protein
MQDGTSPHYMLSITGWMKTLQTGGSVEEELWSVYQDPQTYIPWIYLSEDI